MRQRRDRGGDGGGGGGGDRGGDGGGNRGGGDDGGGRCLPQKLRTDREIAGMLSMLASRSTVISSATFPSPNRICKMADNRDYYIHLHAQTTPPQGMPARSGRMKAWRGTGTSSVIPTLSLLRTRKCGMSRQTNRETAAAPGGWCPGGWCGGWCQTNRETAAEGSDLGRPPRNSAAESSKLRGEAQLVGDTGRAEPDSRGLDHGHWALDAEQLAERGQGFRHSRRPRSCCWRGQAAAGAGTAAVGVLKGSAGGNAQSGNTLVICLACAIRLATPLRKSATKAR